jgi:replicative DNA helicase
MDIERALIAKALQGDGIPSVIAHGVEYRHFAETPTGQECAQIYEWSSTYARQYGVTPSPQMIKDTFPNWYGETAPDPLEAILDEFMRQVRRRFFDSKIIELSKVPADRASWDHLDEILLDAARDLASVVPSGGVARFTDMQKRIEQYEIQRNEGVKPGILLGLPIIDDVMRGVKPGWVITNAGFSGRGKALDLSTPVPTPAGWTTMGELHRGDWVYGSDGQPTLVKFAWPVLEDQICYEVEFSDGSKIVADADHLWATTRDKTENIVTTEEIKKDVWKSDHYTRRHSIRCASPVWHEDADVQLDPYILGYWLGDGTSSEATITVHEHDWKHLKDQLTKAGENSSVQTKEGTTYRIRFGLRSTCCRGHSLDDRHPSGTCKQCTDLHNYHGYYGTEMPPATHFTAQERLRQIGVLGNKHIPTQYLEASIGQRESLLQGIVDSDGYVMDSGRVEISSMNDRFAQDILGLCLSLGIRATKTSKMATLEGRNIGVAYRICFTSGMKVATLPRKAERLKPATNRSTHRYIVAVREVESRPVRCISVEADDKQFLVGKSYIATHNSMLTIWNLLSAFEQDKVALMISLEMSREEVLERLDTMVMNFEHRMLVQRDLAPEEIERWRHMAQTYALARAEIIVLDKMGGCTVDRVFAEINRYKPDIAAVDYVQRMTGTKASMAKWEGLEEITNELKTIAMETDTAIIMVSQDQRGSADQGSTESNMGGSVSIYQAADVYIGMMQDDTMRAQNKMCIKMLKFRHGDRAQVDMWWAPATMEFGPYEGQSSGFAKS